MIALAVILVVLIVGVAAVVIMGIPNIITAQADAYATRVIADAEAQAMVTKANALWLHEAFPYFVVGGMGIVILGLLVLLAHRAWLSYKLEHFKIECRYFPHQRMYGSLTQGQTYPQLARPQEQEYPIIYVPDSQLQQVMK